VLQEFCLLQCQLKERDFRRQKIINTLFSNCFIVHAVFFVLEAQSFSLFNCSIIQSPGLEEALDMDITPGAFHKLMKTVG
jgi:hypothetical protein